MFPPTDSRGYISENGKYQMTSIPSLKPCGVRGVDNEAVSIYLSGF